MKQREIWYADLDPTKGNEQAGLRPIVILSGNILNSLLKVVIACPLTTKVKNYKGNVVLQPNSTNGLSGPSETLIFHIRSVSKERLVRKIGEIEEGELLELKQSLAAIRTY